MQDEILCRMVRARGTAEQPRAALAAHQDPGTRQIQFG